MKLSWFVSVNMIILVGLVSVYQWAKINYDEKDVLAFQIRSLTQKLHQAELKTALVEDQFLGFRQEIAMNIPAFLKSVGETPQGYAARSIASVTQGADRAKGARSREMLANMKFEEAKGAFQRKDYAHAEALLKEFIRTDSFSVSTPSAHLLLVESLYQQGKTEEAVEVIRRVIDLFPGHEVAGFCMIRLGRIMEDNGQSGSAADVYKTVIRTFSQQEVVAQAKASLAGVAF